MPLIQSRISFTRFMDQSRIERLLNDLKEPDADVRDRASAMLWQLWFHQKGVYGFQQLMQAQSLLELGQVIQAEALLSDIVQAQPDFAEAWNRRAYCTTPKPTIGVRSPTVKKSFICCPIILVPFMGLAFATVPWATIPLPSKPFAKL